MIKIAIEAVSKVFGADPQSVLPLIRDGLSKAEILRKTDHVVGIREVSLEVEEGETFVVMGLSGSGKSTLIRHVNRLIEPTAGRILVDGDDILRLDEERLRDLRRHKISMVFQRFGLLPHRSVLENVAFGLITAGRPRREAFEQAERQIALVGLDGFQKSYPRQLSGGMQQRVGLARALASDPEILLMDEAFSALDPLIRNDMQLQLKTLQKRLNKTILFITHDLDEALLLGDHIAILKDGALRQVGRPSDILLNPADDYVARFVRDVNRGRVIDLGSIAEAAAFLSASEASVEACKQALAHHDALVVGNGDGRHRVITRDIALLNAERGQAWWRNPADLPPAPCVAAASTIEEGMAALSIHDGPAVVTDREGRGLGIVTARGLLRALARPAGRD